MWIWRTPWHLEALHRVVMSMIEFYLPWKVKQIIKQTIPGSETIARLKETTYT